LENLPRLNEGILSSTVHFIEKEIHISFKESDISLRQLAELLDKIGYPPLIRLDKAQKKTFLQAFQRSYLSNRSGGFCLRE
jgi:Cu+-exporting ATPase